MQLDEIDTVGIVGAGTMGHGIAQVAATAGYEVVMRDVEERFLSAGFESIERSLDRLVESEERTRSDAADARDRITGTTEMADLEACDIVVEAVTEELSVKQSVFEELSDVCGTDTVLATNTSTLSITAIAAVVDPPSGWLACTS